MGDGVGYALGALLCAALNDIVFKRASSAKVSIGWFACFVGLTWGAAQVTWLAIYRPRALVEWSEPTARYAPWVGLLLASANLLLIASLDGIPASAGSTVYRLNSVGVVLGGWLLLGESLTMLKLGGVTAGVVAVLLMYSAGRAAAPSTIRAGYRQIGGGGGGLSKTEVTRITQYGTVVTLGAVDEAARPKLRGSLQSKPRSTGYYYALAVVASALRACYGLLSKHALRGGADSTQLVLCGAAGWLVVGAAYALVQERSLLGWRDKWCVRFGMVNGVLQGSNIAMLNLALMQGSASIVVPVANCSFALTLTISVLCGMEGMDRKKAAAVGMAALCVGLLARAAAAAAASASSPHHLRLLMLL